MNKKIDIVYTWVDWSDSEWQKKRIKAYNNLDNTSDLSDYANVDGRFRDNQELKYSLRSLEKYFPHHGNIFLITDNQIPDFLKEDSGITIIFHNDFIPNHLLPTFSSRKINAFIPFIEMISEDFFLFNDDVFLWPYFSLDDFQVEEKTIYYFSSEKDKHFTESLSYSDYTWKILKEVYPQYKHIDSIPSHTPKIINKTKYKNIQAEFFTYFDKLSHQIFRERESTAFLSDLYWRWMIHHKKWINGWHKWLYVSTSQWWYDSLLEQFDALPFFCINDTSDNNSDDVWLLNITQILEKLFPEKSSFEK